MNLGRTILVGLSLGLGMLLASPETAEAQYYRGWYGSPYRGYSGYYARPYSYGVYRPNYYSYGYYPRTYYNSRPYYYQFYGVGPNYWSASPYPRYSY